MSLRPRRGQLNVKDENSGLESWAGPRQRLGKLGKLSVPPFPHRQTFASCGFWEDSVRLIPVGCWSSNKYLIAATFVVLVVVIVPLNVAKWKEDTVLALGVSSLTLTKATAPKCPQKQSRASLPPARLFQAPPKPAPGGPSVRLNLTE